jgi:hypothetical protein
MVPFPIVCSRNTRRGTSSGSEGPPAIAITPKMGRFVSVSPADKISWSGPLAFQKHFFLEWISATSIVVERPQLGGRDFGGVSGTDMLLGVAAEIALATQISLHASFSYKRKRPKTLASRAFFLILGTTRAFYS